MPCSWKRREWIREQPHLTQELHLFICTSILEAKEASETILFFFSVFLVKFWYVSDCFVCSKLSLKLIGTIGMISTTSALKDWEMGR